MVAAGLAIWNPGEDAGSLMGQEAEVLEAVRISLEGGNDVNARNWRGETALHGVALRGVDILVDYLVEQGADLTALTDDGWSALAFARGFNFSDFYKEQVTIAARLEELMQARGFDTEGEAQRGAGRRLLRLPEHPARTGPRVGDARRVDGSQFRPHQPRHPDDAGVEMARASAARGRVSILLARIYDVLPLVCPACRGRPEFEFDQSLPDDFSPNPPPHLTSATAKQSPLKFLSVPALQLSTFGLLSISRSARGIQ